MSFSARSVLAVCNSSLYYRNLYKAVNSGGGGAGPHGALAGFTSFPSWCWLFVARDGRVLVCQVYAAVWAGLVGFVVLGVVLEAFQTRADGHGRAGEWFHRAIVGP